MVKQGESISHQQLFRIFDLQNEKITHILTDLPASYRHMCFMKTSEYYQNLFVHLCQKVEIDSESSDEEFRRCIEAEIKYLRQNPGEDPRPLGQLMRIWISQCPNRLISAFKDFEYLEKTGDIDGTSITQMNEAVLDYYTTVMLPNAANNLTASGVEETRNRFVVPGPPPSSASRRMGPPTPGGLSSAGEISAVESASEFNAGFLKHINKRRRVIPMIGSTINFNYQECSSRNNKKESIIMAIKYHKNIVENSTSQLVTYLKSFQQTDDVSGMKHWDGEFRKYAAKSLLKMGNISCEEFVEYCKRGGAKELSSDMLEIKRRQKQSESQERPTKRRKYFHGTSRRNKEIYDLSSESEDSDDTTKKQLTGLPTKNDRSNSSHTEAMARDYLTKSNIIVEPKGKGINGNKNKICYELPLTKWPYIPKDKKGRSRAGSQRKNSERSTDKNTKEEYQIHTPAREQGMPRSYDNQ
nr:MAG: hypothetical protein [Penaeus monodon endogenous nimavirus]